MPALNFKAQFAEPVSNGAKRQTIRAQRKDGRDPKPGDRLYLYTGMRTKACRKLREARCTSVLPVTIYNEADIVYGQRRLGAIERINFAIDDGFMSPRDLADWFEKTHGLPFSGLVIRWE